MIWHSTPINELFEELETNSEKGLSPAQAAERLRRSGLNHLQLEVKQGPWRFLAHRLTDPWSVLLIVIAAISVIVQIITQSGTWWTPILIVSVLVLNAFFTALFHHKAEGALHSLDAGIKSQVQVLRGQKTLTVSSETLVPGDIVFLKQGDLIPADGRLLECNGLSCDESALTGETAPCEKDVDALPEDIAVLTERHNMVYMGCTVLHGTATFVVTDTGLSTEYGKQVLLAKQRTEAELPVKQKLDAIGKTVGILAAVCGLVLLIFAFAFTGQAEQSFVEFLTSNLMLALSFVVAVLPESVSVILTVAVAKGVFQMAQAAAVLKNISKIEALAAVSVICADKTGVMTQNKMQMRQIFDGSTAVSLQDEEPTENMKTLLQMGALCCDASVELTALGKQKKQGDPTEAAIVAACLKHCGLTKSQLENTYPRMVSVPFDSQRQLMTTVNMINNRYYAIVKGAPDKLLACCTAGNIAGAKEQIENFSANALRVIAVGMKPLEELLANPTAEQMECNLTLLGVFGLGDTVRQDTAEALQTCEAAGISTVMMTGDNIHTARAAGEQLGLLNGGKIAATGEEIATLEESQLCAAVSKIGVYSRLDATDRDRVVAAYRQRGETVAVTGDEQCDSLALKNADVGFAMGRKGTDAAKSSADVVLTDDSFSAVVHTVALARNILHNITRAVGFLFSSNLGELIFMLVGIVLFKTAPLTALGLLWINFITDCAPAVALATVAPTAVTMQQKPTEKGRWFHSPLSLNLALQGCLIAIVSLIAFGTGHAVSGETAIMMALFTLGLSQLFGAVNCLSKKPLILAKPRLSVTACVSFGSSLLLLVLTAFTPLALLFGGVALTALQALTCLGLAFAVFAVFEAAKWVQKLLVK